MLRVILQLRPGTAPETAIQGLTSLGYVFGNVSGYGGRPPEEVRDAYIRAVEQVEPVVRSYFTDPEVCGHFRGTRYWAIRQITADSPRPSPLVYEEVQEQQRYLEQLVERLRHLDKWLKAAPGTMAVVDTNVLLHYQPPQQVPWLQVLDLESVRLVLPLRVVEELDAKKYLARDDLADRARRLLAELWALVGPAAGMPVTLPGQEGVTVEVPTDDEPRRRGVDADQEVLSLCSAVKGMGAKAVLVTGDTGMSIRASAQGIVVGHLPDNYLRRQPGKAPKSSSQ